MATFRRIIALSPYVALTYGSMLMSAGCGIASEDQANSAQVSLEIRFQDDTATTPQPAADTPRFASLAAASTAQAVGPTTWYQVARILVDATVASSGQTFFTDFELTQLAPNVWRGDVPLLPRDQQLRFAARALTASGDIAFSGETVAILTADDQLLPIPLAPAQNGQTLRIPRMRRIVYPAEMFAGQEELVAFTILDNAGASIGVQITPAGSPDTPAAEFWPAAGTVTLTSEVANFMTAYTPPEVTTDTDLDYEVTITDARTQGAVAITTNFHTHVRPRPSGIAIGN